MENFRYAVLIDAREVLYSDDLLVLDVLNQHYQNIDFMDGIELEAMVKDAFKDKDLVPVNNIIRDTKGVWRLTNLFDEIGDEYENIRKFFKSRAKYRVLDKVMDKLLEKYKNLVNYTSVTVRNPNLFGIKNNINTFVLFDNSKYDMRSKVMNVLGLTEEDKNILLDMNRLGEFFKTGISISSDIGVKFTIVTSDENIEEFIRENVGKVLNDTEKGMLNCDAIILDKTNRAIYKFQELEKLPEEQRMTYGIFELWGKDILKELRPIYQK